MIKYNCNNAQINRDNIGKYSLVIYTIIIGKQKLPPVEVKPSSNQSLICYTDQKNLKQKGWLVKRLPTLSKDIYINTELIKILPHLFLKRYDASVWVDSGYINAILAKLGGVNDSNEQFSVIDCDGSKTSWSDEGKSDSKELKMKETMVIDMFKSDNIVAIYRRHNSPVLEAMMRKRCEEIIRRMNLNLKIRNLPIKLLETMPVSYSLAHKTAIFLKNKTTPSNNTREPDNHKEQQNKVPFNRNIIHYYPFTDKPLEIRYLEITTKIGCSNLCSYCPQQLLINEYSKRSKEVLLLLDTFKRSLAKLNKSVTIKFTGLSEPFLNQQCMDMVEYAYTKGHGVVISTTLSGMKKEHIRRLEKIYLNSFLVHLPSVSGERFPQDENYEELLKMVINSKINNKSYHFHGNELHPAALAAAKLVKNKGVNTRSGNLDWANCKAGEDSISRPVSCERGFVHPVLLPNGDLILCCMDYGLKTVIGNLLEQEPAAIYKGHAFTELIKATLQDEGSICHSCEDYRVDL